MANIVDGPKSQLDSTVRVFDQFYNLDLVVNASEYDIVYSYFYDVNHSQSWQTTSLVCCLEYRTSLVNQY